MGTTSARVGWLASHAELQASEQRSWVERYQTEDIAALQPRHRSRVAGVLRSVTYAPVGSTTALRAELFDGTGSIELCWTGRRDVPGIVPGRRLLATGMVARGEARQARLLMFNPRYDLIATRPGAG
ncbi:MAG TPA: DNA-binding protein [Micrococcales bacterium]|uniref:OB-fold nucleic acid binding domain-containing protein n=1 Tax=Miniimonas TaxID=947525 RepID=UPI000D525F9B|nr:MULTISPECIES: OB-fold nucleic acid binding domain-containing protein [Miniimonas]HCX84798.1 DNA-binding protein [Micrococcales bacterium]